MKSTAQDSLRWMIAALAAVFMAAASTLISPTAVAQAVTAPDLGAVIAGGLDDGAVGQWWVDDVASGVTVQVFDQGDAQLGTEVGYPGEPDPDGYNWFGVGLGFQLEPGYRLVATGNDSGYVINMTVTDLTVTEVDLENGTISGTTSYYGTGEVAVDLYSDPTGDELVATVSVPKQGPVEGLYTWVADFSGHIDLPTVGMHGQAIDSDADVNAATLVHYSAGGMADSPGLKTIRANLESYDSVFTYGWEIGSLLKLTIEDPDTPASPDLVTSQEFSEDPWFFDVAEWITIEPGQQVSLTDGTTTVDHLVGPLQIASADRATDVVTGIAAPGVPVELIPTDGEDFLGVYYTDPEADGSWQIRVPAGMLATAKSLTSNQFETADPNEDSETQYDWYFPEPSGYVFSGFAEPVDTDAVNLATAGRTVPLKFRVTTDAGDPVTDIADVALAVTTLECELGTTEDQVEEYAAGNSGLQNLGDGYYQYNWKTPKSYRNSCKLLTLDIGDGVPHTAEFHFTR